MSLSQTGRSLLTEDLRARGELVNVAWWFVVVVGSFGTVAGIPLFILSLCYASCFYETRRYLKIVYVVHDMIRSGYR